MDGFLLDGCWAGVGWALSVDELVIGGRSQRMAWCGWAFLLHGLGFVVISKLQFMPDTTQI